MNTMMLGVVVALTVPLAGTTLGSALAFFMKKQISTLFQKALLGFAAGVMIAASVWSLINPAIDMAAEQGIIPWIPAAVGFLAGMGVLLIIDSLLPHLHLDSDKPEGLPSHLKDSTMLFLAIAIHNLPEGMAVGVVLAGFISGQSSIALAGVVALAIGIAVQNIPEGAVISMPLVAKQSFRARCSFWSDRTSRRAVDARAYQRGYPHLALCARFCSRGDDLCGGRGANS